MDAFDSSAGNFSRVLVESRGEVVRDWYRIRWSSRLTNICDVIIAELNYRVYNYLIWYISGGRMITSSRGVAAVFIRKKVIEVRKQVAGILN